MKIAIVGYGIEGKASYDYWNTADNQLTIVDEREELDSVPQGAVTLLGADVLSQLDEFDLIIRSPSINPKKLPYPGKVWSATNEFFAKCPAPIIGVTGTKGKGTTSSLIASILDAAGKTVHLLGNIGKPALVELSNIHAGDIVVYELSSFQLWDLEKSPHVAAVLMIEPDHMNVHESMGDYVTAKGNIASHQMPDDVIIFNRDNQFSRQIATMSPGKKIEYPFIIDEFIPSLKLPGKHNQENAAAAIAAVREFGVSDDEIRSGFAVFEGLPHRLEKVRELDGITYYNDSFSSAPSATVAAIKSFTQPEIIIIGGTDKGADFTELRDTLSIAKNIKNIILVGEIRHKLAEILRGIEYDISDAQTMGEIVDTARLYATKGDVVILSPACASFDMFKNFYDRGDQFREAVRAL
jgi:UDP-N-acetylmuramoylalanine--D-glutamate ligase